MTASPHVTHQDPILATPLREVDWATVSLANMQQFAKAFGVDGHLATRDARGKPISAGVRKKAISKLLAERIKDLALEQQAAVPEVGCVSYSCTAELGDAAEALRKWSNRSQPLLDRLEQAIAGAQTVLSDGSGARAAGPEQSLVADIQSLIASIQALRLSNRSSELQLASTCLQLSPALATAAAALRSTLNSENLLLSVLERDDIRPHLLNPHLLGLRATCRLRAVSTQFQNWVRQSLSSFPQLQIVQIEEADVYRVRAATFCRKETTLDLSSMTISSGSESLREYRPDNQLYTDDDYYYADFLCPVSGSSSAQVISLLSSEEDLTEMGLLISDSSANIVALRPQNPRKYSRGAGMRAFELSDSRLVLFRTSNWEYSGHAAYLATVSPGTASLSEVLVPMSARRSDPAAGLLSDGRILFTGGLGMPTSSRVEVPCSTVRGRYKTVTVQPSAADYAAQLSAEVFDPATKTWSALPHRTLRSDVDTGVGLPDGRFLACSTTAELANAEIYDPKQNCWSAVDGFDVLTDQVKYVPKKNGIAAHTVPIYRSPFENNHGKLHVLGTDLLVLTSRTEVVDGVKVNNRVFKLGRLEGSTILGGWTELPVRHTCERGERDFALFTVPAAS